MRKEFFRSGWKKQTNNRSKKSVGRNAVYVFEGIVQLFGEKDISLFADNDNELSEESVVRSKNAANNKWYQRDRIWWNVAFHRIKKNKKWIFKAVDRKSRKTVAWITGNRDVATFKKLYKQIKHLKKCKFYTDKWIVFSKVLPKRRHFAGKKHTFTIEQNNSNIRHYLARMVRKSKVISRSEFMLNASLKLLFALSFDSSPLQLLLQSVDIFI